MVENLENKRRGSSWPVSSLESVEQMLETLKLCSNCHCTLLSHSDEIDRGQEKWTSQVWHRTPEILQPLTLNRIRFLDLNVLFSVSFTILKHLLDIKSFVIILATFDWIAMLTLGNKNSLEPKTRAMTSQRLGLPSLPVPARPSWAELQTLNQNRKLIRSFDKMLRTKGNV